MCFLFNTAFYANSTSEPMRQAVDKSINFTADHYLISEDIVKFREIVNGFYFNESIISSREDKVLKIEIIIMKQIF